MRVVFEVPGQPIGYYSRGARPNWKRLNAYHSFKRSVCDYAALAGLDLPLRPTKDAPLRVDIEVWFRDDRRPHSDPENVRKGIVDALCYAPAPLKKGDDRWVCGFVPLPRYDKENPRVVVVVNDEA